MRKVALLPLLFIVTIIVAQEQDENAIKYAETITAEELQVHLEIIASDEYEGRETGEKGQQMCADYMADYFSSISIPGCIDSSYYQYYPLEVSKLDGTIEIDKKEYKFLEDFFFFPGTPAVAFDLSEVTFLGYGINDEEYSDYEGNEVKGKTVMVLDGEPYNKKGKSYISKSGTESIWSSNWRLKPSTASDFEIAVLLVVVDNIEDRIEMVRHYLETPSMKLKNNNQEDNSTAVIYISEEIANTILAYQSTSTEQLTNQIEKKGKPAPVVIESDLVIDTRSSGEDIISSNVLAFIEGSDLKDEVIVITAHYDHIGVKEGEVYNGADDDGSGTVALLELADAFQTAKLDGNGPRRSILIMPVSGEEKGLLGSSYYVNNPVFPLENTVCNLNIDMIGRIDEDHAGNANYVYLIGSDMLSTELHDVSEWANTTYLNIELDYTFNDPDDPNRFYYRSDHYNFAKNNIPVIFYFNGVHEDYHQSTDTVDKINYEKIERITQLVFHTAWKLANQDKRIEVDVNTN